MTNERAIELLNRISDSQFDGPHGDERREALSMAVRALFSQQTVNDSQGLVNDCISRNMAIDAVAKWFYDVFGIKESDGTATIFKRLRELPSAQPPEEVVPHKNYKYLSDYWCECGWHLGKKGDVKYCSDCGRKVKWDG